MNRNTHKGYSDKTHDYFEADFMTALQQCANHPIDEKDTIVKFVTWMIEFRTEEKRLDQKAIY